LIRTLQGRTAQRLGQQVITQWGTEAALGLAVDHHDVFIPGGGQLQIAVGIEFTHAERAEAFVAHPLFEGGALGTTHPQGERIGLGAQ